MAMNKAPHLHIYATPAEVLTALADYFVELANSGYIEARPLLRGVVGGQFSQEILRASSLIIVPEPHSLGKSRFLLR